MSWFTIFSRLIRMNPTGCRLIPVVILVSICIPCEAAFEYDLIGARPAAMGGAYVALIHGSDHSSCNPAGLPFIRGSSVSASFSRPFGIEDLGCGSLGYSRRAGDGGWGLGWRSFGNRSYTENTFSLSHGRTIWKGISVGVTMNMLSLAIRDFGSATAWGIDIGCLVALDDDIHFGMHSRQINTPRLGRSGEQVPGRFSLGVSTGPYEDLTLAAEVSKEERFGPQFHAGQEYRIAPLLAVRFGVHTGPTTISAGAGFSFDCYRINYAFSSHAVLGITHLFSLTVRLGGVSGSSDPSEDY